MTAPEPASPEPLALRPPPPVPLVPVPPHVAAPAAAVFGGFARLRGRRPMHPVGVVTEATVAIPDDDRLPEAWRTLDGAAGIARFSKSIGLPGRVPDVLGMALRFGGQDILLSSAAGSAPLLQHLLVPTVGFDGTVFTGLLPHRIGSRAAVVHARVPQRLPAADSYLEAVAKAAPFVLDLTAVGMFGGALPLGTVTIGAVLEGPAAERVRFDPWRAGGGLRPLGPLQRTRAAAYAASRAATRR